MVGQAWLAVVAAVGSSVSPIFDACPVGQHSGMPMSFVSSSADRLQLEVRAFVAPAALQGWRPVGLKPWHQSENKVELQTWVYPRQYKFETNTHVNNQLVTKLFEWEGFHSFLQLNHRDSDDDHVKSMKKIGRIECREVFNTVLLSLFRLF